MKNIENKKALGIYIHIPFCVRKCYYCDFLSYSDNETANIKEIYVNALLEEIKSCYGEYSDYIVETIFFGGGTPSSINGELIGQLMNVVKRNFCCSPDMEVTLEANPGTVSYEKIQIYKNSGINRLSFGLQSADNEELKMLGRIHTFEEFKENYILARKIGIKNINVDLMSGLPYQTLDKFSRTLEKVTDLEPEHISVYSLIIEENTLFYKKYENNYKIFPTEETDREIYSYTKKYLWEKGYERYEISNYTRQGYESRHNLSCWRRIEYLGFGLGASSYAKGIRYNNEENINMYIKNARDRNQIIKNKQIMTRKSYMEEFMFLGLRLMKGISREEFYNEFNVSLDSVFGKIINKYLKTGFLCERGDYIAFTESGIDVSNTILADFIFD